MFIFLGINILFTILDTVLFSLLGIPAFVDIGVTANNYLDNLPNTSPQAMLYTLFISITYFIVIAPLMLGTSNWFYSLTGGKKMDIASVFIFFDRIEFMIKSWVINIIIAIRTILWGALFFSVPILISYLINGFSTENLGTFLQSMYLVANLGCLVLYVIAAIATFLAHSKYFLSHYLIIENKHISPHRAVRLSANITKGKRQQILKFKLSFLPLLLPSLLIIPLFYTMPYYGTGLALYGRVMISVWKSEHPEEIIYGDNINQEEEDIPQYIQTDL